ncbi:hypothetical protein Q5752_000041 [Cryptotrichosporon argae]
MDNGLFIFLLFVFFFTLSALIFCFLSTCLGLPLRRSDLLSAFSSSSPPVRRPRTTAGRAGATHGAVQEYELDAMLRSADYGDARLGGDDAEYEMMRRGGPGRGFF